jgi:release factor glutamine methyltransferase
VTQTAIAPTTVALSGCREITESSETRHASEVVMVRGGAPSTSRGAGLEKDVDGRPAPTMTGSGDSALIAAIVSPRTPTTVAPTTLARAIRDGAARLEATTDNPRLEARLLLAHALGLTQNDLIREPDRPVDPDPYQALLTRRIAHEPLALITGHREFWSLDFLVSPATLIPRPDSETLIEAALAAFADRQPPRTILDLGTGTGCLLLALLTEFPSAFGIGVDLAPAAASLAKTNAARLGLADRSAFATADWTNPLTGLFDLIVSNPPYIPGPDIAALMPEVAQHEPRTALDGGADGYDAYRRIVPHLSHHLIPNGIAVLELGQGQANYVEDIARSAGFQTSRRLDLAQIPRAIVLARPNRENIVWQHRGTGVR